MLVPAEGRSPDYWSPTSDGGFGSLPGTGTRARLCQFFMFHGHFRIALLATAAVVAGLIAILTDGNSINRSE